MNRRDSWNPEQYEKFKSQRTEPFSDLVAMIRPVADARVVDLGCGTGELTAELHSRLQARETLGLDSSEEMLKKAHNFAQPGLSFSKGEISTWRDDEGRDLIFSNAALQWCPNHVKLFADLKESLKRGGQLAVQMPMNHDYPTHVLAREMAGETKWANILNDGARVVNLLTIEDYASLLFKLGFQEQRVLLKVYGHELPSRAGVIEWVKGSLLTYYQSRLSAQEFAQFVDEYQARLFQRLPDDQPFFYPFKRALLWAQL